MFSTYLLSVGRSHIEWVWDHLSEAGWTHMLTSGSYVETDDIHKRI